MDLLCSCTSVRTGIKVPEINWTLFCYMQMAVNLFCILSS